MFRHNFSKVSDQQGPSLIINGLASYDRPNLLVRAFKSIQDQRYKNIEILINDNGSCNSEVNRASLKLKCNTNPEALCCDENQMQTS